MHDVQGRHVNKNIWMDIIKAYYFKLIKLCYTLVLGSQSLIAIYCVINSYICCDKIKWKIMSRIVWNEIYFNWRLQSVWISWIDRKWALSVNVLNMNMWKWTFLKNYHFRYLSFSQIKSINPKKWESKSYFLRGLTVSKKTSYVWKPCCKKNYY